MTVSSNFAATLTLNTLGGSNSPAPTDSYNATVSLGTQPVGPLSVAVTSTPALVPLSAIPTTAVYHLMVAHTGASTDPGIVLDMRNNAGNSSKLTINPGGRVYFYNITLSTAVSAKADWAQWYLSTASGTTTASVSLVYT